MEIPPTGKAGMSFRKHNREKPGMSLGQLWKRNMHFVVVLAALYILSFFNPVILIFAIFETIDLIKHEFLYGHWFSSIDIVFIFGVIVSYYYSPAPAILLFFVSLINRAVLGHISLRHITKIARILMLFFITPLFNSLSLFTVGILLLCLNYLLKYGVAIIINGTIDLEKVNYDGINFVGSLIIFFFVSTGLDAI